MIMNIYKCNVHLMRKSETEKEFVCDIEGDRLIYQDTPTHNGLQCNIRSSEKNHDKIKDLCEQVSRLMIKIHELNN